LRNTVTCSWQGGRIVDDSSSQAAFGAFFGVGPSVVDPFACHLGTVAAGPWVGFGGPVAVPAYLGPVPFLANEILAFVALPFAAGSSAVAGIPFAWGLPFAVLASSDAGA